jgi:polysaccharide export outer membrane protein
MLRAILSDGALHMNQVTRCGFGKAVLCIFALVGVLLPAAVMAQAPSKSKGTAVAKDLADYIQDARKLGLNDDELKVNAIRAGWKAGVVDEALKALPASPNKDADNPEKPDRGVPDEYIIGEADVLGVLVYKEPDASIASVPVRADGKVTLPLIKDVLVAGLTPAQAEKMITTKLMPFIIEPDVNVVVREIHSKRIYLVGALHKQGPVDLRYPMTVLQAITEAGGLNEFAKRKLIFVRRTENGSTFQLPFDYDAVLRGQKTEQNVWLKPGDYVIVPQ